MKHKTIELLIKTSLENPELIEIMNQGTKNLKQLGITLLQINIKGSADSKIKGIIYE